MSKPSRKSSMKPAARQQAFNDNAQPVKRRLDPNIAQRQASDPAASVWVTASAGTGKTKVLTDRVLRLMLGGAHPNEILCLTFTRAGASVMVNRIRDELSQWATCDEDVLAGKLRNLQGRRPTPEMIRRARQMFAIFLDAPGSLRIQTIHSFSQDLLRRFPIESGIPPYFDVMDEQSAVEMLKEAQADLLRDIALYPDTPLARAVRMITPEVNEDDFDGLIGELTYRRGQLLALIEEKGGLSKLIDDVYDYLSAPRHGDARQMRKQLNSAGGLSGWSPAIDDLKQAADILAGGTSAELERAKVMKAWLLNPSLREELFKDYARVFLTAEGTMRARLTTKATSHAQEILEREAQRLIRGIEDIATVNVARGTESLLRMVDDILRRYSEKKRALNRLDYDDLVYHAGRMMQEDNAAGWVLQKLPGNLRHVLVDEAQDTNPDQWQLVSSIVQEFFTGKTGVKDENKTLFVVGDEKQSIFSFQRADPEEFGRRKKMFAELVRGNGGTWRTVQMDIAFRSSPAITQAVDAVFANPAAADGLFFKEEQDERKVQHNPYRRGQAGVVEVHPTLRPVAKPEPDRWAPPVETEETAALATDLADKIADQIKSWLESGEKLESRKRPINPGDIMILVRRRSAFVDHMVRALKKRDIPVSGADRMSLRGQIVVMDMVALGEVLLFERDDERLACVLRSPLIGMSEQQLEDLAVGRDGFLWDALAAKAADDNVPRIYRDTFDYLLGLRESLTTERPYEFYSSVLMNPCPAQPKGSGLNALKTRLGFEAEDPLVEFLNAVESFEKIHVPSLQGFISWFQAGEAEVKREVSLGRETPRVNIMTVHGSKGLEAPIVILPDTTGVPADNTRARPRFLWPMDDRDVPLWVPRADLENSVFTRERVKIEKEYDREYRRLLYVALTRPADRLYVYGTESRKRLAPDSWYSLIRQGLEDNLAGQIAYVDADGQDVGGAMDDDGESIIRFQVKQTARPQPDGVKPLEKLKLAGVPQWARSEPGGDQSRVEKFIASDFEHKAETATAPSPLSDGSESYHMNLGNAVHKLFEIIPAVAPERRAAAAEKFLAKPAWNINARDRKILSRNVIRIIEDPKFGILFGEHARAEVTISGHFERAGKRHEMPNKIDRLVVKGRNVTIVDFKNSFNVPDNAKEVSEKYLVQMAAYRFALRQIYPDKSIRCALLYTRQSKLVPLPFQKLNAVIKKLGLKPLPPRREG